MELAASARLVAGDVMRILAAFAVALLMCAPAQAQSVDPGPAKSLLGAFEGMDFPITSNNPTPVARWAFPIGPYAVFATVGYALTGNAYLRCDLATNNTAIDFQEAAISSGSETGTMTLMGTTSSQGTTIMDVRCLAGQGAGHTQSVRRVRMRAIKVSDVGGAVSLPVPQPNARPAP